MCTGTQHGMIEVAKAKFPEGILFLTRGTISVQAQSMGKILGTNLRKKIYRKKTFAPATQHRIKICHPIPTCIFVKKHHQQHQQHHQQQHYDYYYYYHSYH